MDGESLECCAVCRFWDRDNQQQVAPPNQPSAMHSRCRRFPPTAALATVVTPLLLGRQPSVQQVPSAIPTVTPAGEWCGEFQLEIRAKAYGTNRRSQ